MSCRSLRAPSLARRRIRAVACATMAVVAIFNGCVISEEPPPVTAGPVLACESDEDCETGGCNATLGACVVSSSQLGSLLLRITPAPLDPSYQGREYFTVIPPLEGPADEVVSLQIPSRVSLSGSVEAGSARDSCLSSTPEVATLPVELTFTPQERLLGMSVRSYSIKSGFTTNSEHRFEALLPPGRYDVYVEPDLTRLDPGCEAVPQLFRNRPVGVGQELLPPAQPETRSVRLTAPWVPAAQGWVLDMIHPVTGEVISNRVVLDEADVVNGEVIAPLHYSTTQDDYIREGGELVRVQPPRGTVAGTAFFTRENLLGAAPGLPDIFSGWVPVEFGAWVWRLGDINTPVTARVEFIADGLSQALGGVTTKFRVNTEVDRLGRIDVTLLPGDYRVRVRPPNAPQQSIYLAGYEVPIRVLENDSGGDTQQRGQRIGVPVAPSTQGRVRTLSGSVPVTRAEVWATNSTYGPALCPPTDDPDAGICVSEDPNADEEQPFIARNVSTRVDNQGQGRFVLQGLDCQECSERSGAPYDLSVRPDPGTVLPWYIQPAANLEIRGDRVLNVRTPFVRSAELRYANGAPVVNARVQVYARIQSDLSTASEVDLPPCSTLATITRRTPCIQSVLEVARTTSDAEGRLMLVLPPALN